jgi:signal transduction histidine kinase
MPGLASRRLSTVLCSAPWAGYSLCYWRAVAAEARAVQLERDHEQRAHAADTTERRRIARDLHDVIAPSVSVMTVQAGARMQLPNHPDRAIRVRPPWRRLSP